MALTNGSPSRTEYHDRSNNNINDKLFYLIRDVSKANKKRRVGRVLMCSSAIFLYTLYVIFTYHVFQSPEISQFDKAFTLLLVILIASLMWTPILAIYDHLSCLFNSEIHITSDRIRQSYKYAQKEIVFGDHIYMEIILEPEDIDYPLKSLIGFSFYHRFQTITFSINDGWDIEGLRELYPELIHISQFYNMKPGPTYKKILNIISSTDI